MDSRLYNPENLLIFGITGYARSGKDTAAKIISDLIAEIESENRRLDHHNIHKCIIRHADPIKDAVAEVMKYFFEPELDSNSMSSELLHSREIANTREKLDEHKDKGEKIYDIDIRRAFQQVGGVFRSQNKDIFALIATKQVEQDIKIHENLKKSYRDKQLSHNKTKYIYIVPDTRFVNEEKFMREKFGSCYQLIKIDKPDITEKAKRGEPPYDHESEKQIEMLSPDKIITNDSTLVALKENVTAYALKVMRATSWLN